jgi:hypothetical protein
MTYVGDLMAREAAVLSAVEQKWKAGLKVEAREQLRVLAEDIAEELKEWGITRERLAILTRYMSNRGVEEAKGLLETYIGTLRETVDRLAEEEARYCAED